MTKIFYWLYRALSGTAYRLERRLTRAGWFVLALGCAVAIVGTDLERAVGHRTFALLFALLLVGICWVPFFRGSFVALRCLPRTGAVGEPLTYRVVVTNRSHRPKRGLSLLEILADQRMTLSEFTWSLRPSPHARSLRLKRQAKSLRHIRITEGELPPLLAGESGEATMRLIPRQRGVLRFEGVAVARTDPFGLVRSLIRVPAPQTLIILPRRYPIPGLVLPGTPRCQPGGVDLASRVGSSDEFASLRDYRHGDPQRHIHWKTWARVGHPVVKEFQDEEFTRHALILDTFTRPDNSLIFEEAVAVAASFACAARTQESLLDLMVIGPRAYCFTTGRGLAHTEQMLEILAAVKVTPDASFEVLQNLVLRHASGLSGAVCVLTAWDAPRQELVRGLRARRVPVLVLVIGGTEAESTGATPLDPGPMKDQVAKFHVLTIGKIAEGLRALAGSAPREVVR